jgi:serine/threonine-protein kinase
MLHQVIPCDTCAHSYNPDAVGGDVSQNDDQVGLAIDGNPTSSWPTQQYYSGTLGKPGVGIYVDANPAVVARVVELDTSTPGWSVQIRARSTPPNLSATDPGGTAAGWTQIGSAPYVQRRQRIPLATGGQRYRYYLVWITRLPAGQNSVDVNEILLYR